MDSNSLFITLIIYIALLTAVILFFFVNPELEQYSSLRRMYLSNNSVDSLSFENSDTVNEKQVKNRKGVVLLEDSGRRKNVLFFIVDDMRPHIGAYQDPEHPDYFSKIKTHTPNLDELATASILFRHAYVQFSLCGPSRASMLTSRRPEVTRVFTNKRYWRNSGGNFTTLPQYFKNNGYTSLGFGKVYHGKESSHNDDAPSWSQPFYLPPFSDKHFMPTGSGAGLGHGTETRTRKCPSHRRSHDENGEESIENIGEGR